MFYGVDSKNVTNGLLYHRQYVYDTKSAKRSVNYKRMGFMVPRPLALAGTGDLFHESGYFARANTVSSCSLPIRCSSSYSYRLSGEACVPSNSKCCGISGV